MVAMINTDAPGMVRFGTADHLMLGPLVTQLQIRLWRRFPPSATVWIRTAMRSVHGCRLLRPVGPLPTEPPAPACTPVACTPNVVQWTLAGTLTPCGDDPATRTATFTLNDFVRDLPEATYDIAVTADATWTPVLYTPQYTNAVAAQCGIDPAQDCAPVLTVEQSSEIVFLARAYRVHDVPLMRAWEDILPRIDARDTAVPDAMVQLSAAMRTLLEPLAPQETQLSVDAPDGLMADFGGLPYTLRLESWEHTEDVVVKGVAGGKLLVERGKVSYSFLAGTRLRFAWSAVNMATADALLGQS